MSAGFSKAGFRVVAAFDNWRPAIETYRRNFGDHVHEFYLSDDFDPPRADVFVGGPPCQGFSSAGMRKSDDARNSLVGVYARTIAKAKPRAFVFENVEGFLTGGEGSYVFELLEPLLEAGYRIHLRKINAANYGIPQHRKRVIGIGGLYWNPSFPTPTHHAFGAPGTGIVAQHLPKTPTIREALSGLAAATTNGKDSEFDHSFSPLTGLDVERAIHLQAGQHMRDLPEHLQHKSYKRRALRRVMDGTPTEKRGGAPAGLRRLKWDEPSKAITGGALSEFLHPEEHRSLTVRECARIQTFPDDFVFSGTLSQKVQLIGNAVPPTFAFKIASQLIEDLSHAKPTFDNGALLSFRPTESNGMSPVLQKVRTAVMDRFGSPDTEGYEVLLWP